MGVVDCCIVLHCLLIGKMASSSLSEILDPMCCSVAKLHLAPSWTLSN